jgi:hypothetical protein
MRIGLPYSVPSLMIRKLTSLFSCCAPRIPQSLGGSARKSAHPFCGRFSAVPFDGRRSEKQCFSLTASSRRKLYGLPSWKSPYPTCHAVAVSSMTHIDLKDSAGVPFLPCRVASTTQANAEASEVRHAIPSIPTTVEAPMSARVRTQHVDVHVIVPVSQSELTEHVEKYKGLVISFSPADSVRPFAHATIRFSNLWRATDCTSATLFQAGELASMLYARGRARRVSP